MIKHSRKGRALAVLAILPIAGLSGLAGAAQYVPLFEAQVITRSLFDAPDIAQRYVYKTNTVDVHCDSSATAYIRSDRGDGTYGPPIIDNYITAGNDLVSACQGGPALPSPILGGTHCFNTGTTAASEWGKPIETAFTAPNVTAPLQLNPGSNSTTFKLWDYGGVLGNTKLVLELPAACNTINQWCSPGYWKNHPAAWTPLASLPQPILPTDPWDGPIKYDVKKCARYGVPLNPTLFEVISTPQCYGGEAANAVADMLSAAHPGVSFFGVRVEGSCPLN